MKIFPKPREEIINIIRSGQLRIGIYGLGKIGLPLAVAYANAGCHVIGVDINPEVVKMVNQAKSFLPHEPGVEEGLKLHINNGRIKATTDITQAAYEADVILIIVPTSVDSYKRPNLQPLFSVCKGISKGLKIGDVVILESTVPPGTTEGPVRKILENNSGLVAGKDFALAFSPERVRSGQVISDFIENYPKIVGGINKKSTDTVATFFQAIIKKGVIKVSNPRTAEAVKVFKGIYRDVNIALANELAKLAEKLQIDIIEVIRAANTEPYSHIHFPGAGVGGHCIPVYPYFALSIAEKLGINMSMTYLARKINDSMPKYLVDLVIKGLNKAGKAIKGSRIAILGLTFRGDVKETYNSPAKPIIEELKKLGAEIIAHDPLITESEAKKEFNVKKIESIEEVFKNADCMVLITDHSQYKKIDIVKLIRLMNRPPVIIDGRNIFNPHELCKINVIYRGVGRNFPSNK